ncbi:hypothetical protein F0919_05925 [Taibaiella lutea]|uniref:Carboxypeptidase-like regulatory domain-containing protein n=1 Tax=Taibaiella lutea TaxID=2608001 RepID=A0A5M6CPJ7_9BACT|nr:hypothetical protein [Taibaiella lutea]KAA5537208.1 hypothetical protein F0919_05925 [Taibaiella lutea]
MSRSVIIQIPEPCHENWEGMKPNACGRFCTSCEKIVIDFSHMTDSELIKIISNTGSRACGRFDESQLNRPIAIAREKSSGPFLFVISKVAASFILLQTLVNNSFGQKLPVSSIEQTAHTNTGDGRKLIIKGRIQDFNTKKPLTGMEITVSGISYVKYSDAEGHFQFVLPDSFQGKKIIISANYQPSASPEIAGTIIREEYVTFDEGEQQKEIQLYRYPFSEMEPFIMEIPYGPPVAGGIYLRENSTSGDMVIKIERPSFFQRIKNIFKKKKH